MRRSIALLLVAALAAWLVVGLVYGAKAGTETAVLGLSLGAVSLTLAHALTRRRPTLGRLPRQFALAVAIAISQLVAAVIAFSVLMFVSTEDAVLIIVSVAFAGLVAIRAAQLFAGDVLRDVEAVRDGLVAVGEGERRLRIETGACDEIAELAAAANAMTEKLAKTERARRDLVGAVSHDLRTPLTSLRLLAQAIDDDIGDEATRRRYVASMSTHIEALSKLIDDLFELSRLEAGDIEWSLERVAVADLVGDTVAAMSVQADARQVRVVAELPPQPGEARANSEKLQRVLFNLIQNAIRHTPADGSVTVRVETTADEVEIEVADTGSGIERADRYRVFEPFYKGTGNGSRTEEGSGLGLAISRAIVEAHGGRIWLVDSRNGARVRFTLPRAA
jgi:signal transduction histidine kinase